MASSDPTLLKAPFGDVIAAAEALGSSRGVPQVIQLYSDWLAAQVPGTRDMHAAWFNLATELSNAGDLPGAMRAYRSALTIRPDFHPAAMNLGLLLERQGQKPEALQIWTSTLQSNDARITLLNQRARLLEECGLLADAAESMRTSLLTKHDQPDVVQHWVHGRQKMCQWPVLAETIPGLSRDDLIAQSGPLAGLALTDDVATQRAIAAAWIARKTQPAPEHLAPLAAIATTVFASATCRPTFAVTP